MVCVNGYRIMDCTTGREYGPYQESFTEVAARAAALDDTEVGEPGSFGGPQEAAPASIRKDDALPGSPDSSIVVSAEARSEDHAYQLERAAILSAAVGQARAYLRAGNHLSAAAVLDEACVRTRELLRRLLPLFATGDFEAAAAALPAIDPKPEPLSIIGMDAALTKKIADVAFRALRRLYEYTELRDTRRGYSFTVLADEGRVMRVTVEMEPWKGS